MLSLCHDVPMLFRCPVPTYAAAEASYHSYICSNYIDKKAEKSYGVLHASLGTVVRTKPQQNESERKFRSVGISF